MSNLASNPNQSCTKQAASVDFDGFASVLSVERATGVCYRLNPLARWSTYNNVPPVLKIEEPYGEMQAWPADAWGECHAVDLHELFSEGKLK